MFPASDVGTFWLPLLWIVNSLITPLTLWMFWRGRKGILFLWAVLVGVYTCSVEKGTRFSPQMLSWINNRLQLSAAPHFVSSVIGWLYDMKLLSVMQLTLRHTFDVLFILHLKSLCCPQKSFSSCRISHLPFGVNILNISISFPHFFQVYFRSLCDNRIVTVKAISTKMTWRCVTYLHKTCLKCNVMTICAFVCTMRDCYILQNEHTTSLRLFIHQTFSSIDSALKLTWYSGT